MRIERLTLLLVAVALLLSGCRVSSEVENQAYVLVLGLDRSEGGDLTLTAKVPRIGKGKPEETDGGGDYLLFSGSGRDFPHALDALEQATPRQMNLSHIELIVASEALASEAGFPGLVARIAETPHLYTSARFVVCEGSASSFIDAQETVIGTRLSSEINAMLEHYARQGFIPDARFADAYYLAGSIYGDATAIRGSVSSYPDSRPALSLIEPEDPAGSAVQSPMRQRYSGTMLFREGVLAGALDAGETRLLNLIRSSTDAFPFECDGSAYTLTPERRVKLGVDAQSGALSVLLELSTLDDVCAADGAKLERALSSAMTALIRRCQALGSEPFGFSEVAAGRFWDVPSWRESNWREAYARADVKVTVRVRSSSNK